MADGIPLFVDPTGNRVVISLDMVPVCASCVHFHEIGTCTKSHPGRDMVTGETVHSDMLAIYARLTFQLCGLDGRWFEPGVPKINLLAPAENPRAAPAASRGASHG